MQSLPHSSCQEKEWSLTDKDVFSVKHNDWYDLTGLIWCEGTLTLQHQSATHCWDGWPCALHDLTIVQAICLRTNNPDTRVQFQITCKSNTIDYTHKCNKLASTLCKTVLLITDHALSPYLRSFLFLYLAVGPHKALVFKPDLTWILHRYQC
jgi:hypothetical protein